MSYAPYPELLADGTILVNNSSLTAFATCDLRGLLHAWRLGSIEDGVALTAGTMAHEAFAIYLTTHDAERALDHYKTRYRPFADEHVDPTGPMERLLWEHTSFVLAETFRRWPIDDDNWLLTPDGQRQFQVHPDLIEVEFNLWLDEAKKIRTRGRLDCMVTDPSGHWRVPDLKTTGQIRRDWIEKFRLESQFSNYLWAASRHVGELVIGGYVLAVEFSTPIENTDKKCALHKVPKSSCRSEHVKTQIEPVDRTEEMLEQWHNDAVRLAERYRKLLTLFPSPEETMEEELHSVATQGRFNDGCKWCFAKTWCERGRQHETLSGFRRAEVAANGNA